MGKAAKAANGLKKAMTKPGGGVIIMAGTKTAPAVARQVQAAKARTDPLDSRGRKIGARAKGGVGRVALAGGYIEVTAEERSLLRSIASRRTVSRSGGTAFDRAMSLGVGECDVATDTTLQAFATTLGAARRNELLEGRDFNYHYSAFSPGVGLPAIGVLWIQRTA